MNKASFIRKCEELFPGSDSDEFADQVFRVFDSNGDGKTS